MRRLRSMDAGIYWQLPAALAIAAILFVASVSQYILFHSVAEIFAIAISGAAFTFAWNSRRFSDQYYLLFVAIALLAASAINILHTLSFKGLGIFPDQGANLPTQLWLGRRYLESIALLIAPLFLVRKFKPSLMMLAFAAATAVLIWSVFGGLFPTAYVDGAGLTPFKIASEYLIASLFIAAAFWLYRERNRLDPGTASKLIAALIVSAAAEILFTLYVGVYDLPNRMGHFLTVITYYLIYRAIVESGVIKPYALLSQANISLSQREAALSETTARLQAEADARRQAQAGLERQRRELQALAHRLVEVQEDQSRSLSREIHDTSGQSLTALAVGLAMLKRKGNWDDAMMARIEELSRIADTVTEDLHRLSVNLRPASLDRYGLAAALEQLIRSVEKQSGIEVDYVVSGLDERLPEDMETALYRIVQEATTNIIRYSQANTASVVIERGAGSVRVVVADDGCGFDVAEALSRGRLGLVGMRERALMLGGTFAITSIPGSGATVRVEAPLAPSGQRATAGASSLPASLPGDLN